MLRKAKHRIRNVIIQLRNENTCIQMRLVSIGLLKASIESTKGNSDLRNASIQFRNASILLRKERIEYPFKRQ